MRLLVILVSLVVVLGLVGCSFTDSFTKSDNVRFSSANYGGQLAVSVVLDRTPIDKLESTKTKITAASASIRSFLDTGIIDSTAVAVSFNNLSLVLYRVVPADIAQLTNGIVAILGTIQVPTENLNPTVVAAIKEFLDGADLRLVRYVQLPSIRSVDRIVKQYDDSEWQLWLERQ